MNDEDHEDHGPLTGLDTETQYGKAILLCTPDRMLIPQSIEAILSWLMKERRYACYNLTYDAQSILKWLSDVELSHLYVFGSILHRPYRIKWVPNRYLRISRDGQPRTEIYNVSQFFDGSLDQVAERVLGERKQELPMSVRLEYLETGRMGDALSSDYRDQVIDYCRRDAELAGRLSAVVQDSCDAAGISTARPVSGASFARKLFRDHEVDLGFVGAKSESLGREAHLGGRIDITARGNLGPCSFFDLNAAYPSVMVSMQNPGNCDVSKRRGVLAEQEGIRPDAEYGVFDASIYIPPPPPGKNSMPVAVPMTDYRTSRRIGARPCLYPYGVFSGAFDLHTMRLVDEIYGPDHYRIARSVQWMPRSDQRPFRFLSDLYAERKRPGNEAAQLAIKAAMNACYGLLAERIHYRREAQAGESFGPQDRPFMYDGRLILNKSKRGNFSHPVLAAHVTGAIRARLFREAPHAVMYATDGVAMLGRDYPDGPIGPGMGQWGSEGRGDLVLIQSGIYVVTPQPGSGGPPCDPGLPYRTKHRGMRSDPMGLLRLNLNAKRIKHRTLQAPSIAEVFRSAELSWSDLNVLTSRVNVLRLNTDFARRWPGPLTAWEYLGDCQRSRPRSIGIEEVS